MNRDPQSKDTQKLTVNSEATAIEVIDLIRGMFAIHKYLTISIRPGKDRSVEQNRLWRRMYKRISEQTGQGTEEDAKAYCKLMLGVPILRRDCERFAAGYDRYFAGRPYEEQLFLMGKNPLFGPDGFPVTRLFGTKQGVEFTDAIADHYAPEGVTFTDILEAAQ